MNSTHESLKVAIVLIGNELLSGKIRDENGYYVARRLRALGATITRIVVIPDERQEIIDELRLCVAQSDVVITSGGVGPTHDDITLECVAEAFGVGTFIAPKLATLINTYFAERVTDAHLRMATIPEGSCLIDAGEHTWPIVQKESVYVMPGVPEAFRAKFEVLADRFRHGQWYLRSLYLNVDEGTIAELLTRLESSHSVSIGSYPKWRGTDYRVRVTIEARGPARVNRAMDEALGSLSEDSVVRFDPPLAVPTS